MVLLHYVWGHNCPCLENTWLSRCPNDEVPILAPIFYYSYNTGINTLLNIYKYINMFVKRWLNRLHIRSLSCRWWFRISAQHCVTTKDVKTDTYYCYVRCTTKRVLIREINWSTNRCNSLPYTVRTSRQSFCNNRVIDFLLRIKALLRLLYFT